MFKTLVYTAFLALMACGASAAEPMPDAWALWSEGFTSTMTTCTADGQTGCLTKAFTRLDRPAAVSDAPVDDLYRDLRTAEVLLHQKEASDALWKLYGIDSSDYIGTGDSVPLAGVGAKNYEFATQREYFVPNLCAEAVDPVVCPKKDAHIWTWRLTPDQLRQWADKPIIKLLRTRAPTADARHFPKYTRNAPKPNLPSLLIRFGSLPLADYKGTFGRPDASRVFFADYGQVRGKTLRAAMVATGASTLLDNPEASKIVFIWIYAPGVDSEASVASWKELFRLLSASQ